MVVLFNHSHRSIGVNENVVVPVAVLDAAISKFPLDPFRLSVYVRASPFIPLIVAPDAVQPPSAVQVKLIDELSKVTENKNDTFAPLTDFKAQIYVLAVVALTPVLWAVLKFVKSF